MDLGDLPPTQMHEEEETEERHVLDALPMSVDNDVPINPEVQQTEIVTPPVPEPEPPEILRRVSGYTVFVHQLHAILMEENPHSTFSSRASLIATLWSMMSKSERDMYAKTADEVYNKPE